jgi:hypothetical protein
MSNEVKMPPRIGPWHETMMEDPDGTDFVLGFYPDHPCVNTKVVYCVQTCALDGDVESVEWFDIDNGEVDEPACWAAIIYPEEDEA